MFALAKVKQAAVGVRRQCFRVKSLNRLRAFSTGDLSSKHGEEGNDVYDIIISGGGMVGTAMACSLGELLKTTKQTVYAPVKFTLCEGSLHSVWPERITLFFFFFFLLLTPACLTFKCSFSRMEVFSLGSE